VSEPAGWPAIALAT